MISLVPDDRHVDPAIEKEELAGLALPLPAKKEQVAGRGP